MQNPPTPLGRSADSSAAPDRAPSGVPPIGPPPDVRGAAGVLRRGQPEFRFDEREYEVRLARTTAELEAAQRLRFEVFNRELGEGLAESEATGRDSDPFDAHCDHLLLIHRAGAVRAGSAPTESIGAPISTDAAADEAVPRVVGTYRLATLAMASQGVGLYCDQEYDLDRAPRAILEQGTELGRACIARDHRRGHALFALFRGLARYAVDSGQRYLYGCCSLTGTDPLEGSLARAWLAARGKVHPEFYVPARAAHHLDLVPVDEAAVESFKLPQLFGTYLRYGAMVCSEPAVDRDFGTIDFLVMFDLEMLDERVRRLFLEG